jgi:diguanylate cyclase (GGDEF)-like protein
MVHYSAFLICSIPTMIVFGLMALFNANYLLSFLILISALGLLIGLVMLYRVQNGKIIYRLNMLFFLILVLYMVYMGGDGGSKSLWAFIFSLIAFFLLGLKEGSLWCIGAFIFLAGLFWNPLGFEHVYPYVFSFKIRFLISYVIISFVTSWFEYFRSHYQQDLKMKNQALEEEHQQLTQEIQERKRLEKDLKIIANTDALTGIMNRRYFWQQTNTEIQRHSRYGHSMALLMLDIDLFKKINDTYGHPVGDKVIQSLAQILIESVRKIDLVGRLGGEEFGVLLIETSHEKVMETAQRLRKNIMNASIEHDARVIDFTASIGVTPARPSEDTVEILVARADRALYRAKENGRNRVELYR